MGVMDLDLQRERRVELLREAEDSRRVRRPRRRGIRGGARGLWRIASAWTIGR